MEVDFNHAMHECKRAGAVTLSTAALMLPLAGLDRQAHVHHEPGHGYPETGTVQATPTRGTATL